MNINPTFKEPEPEKADTDLLAMVQEYQCSGCLFGSSPRTCGKFRLSDNELSCFTHVMGTIIPPIGCIALGMPKGFCRPGYDADRQPLSRMSFRLWKKGTAPEWNNLNVAVWALEKDGVLFVRTCLPRVNAMITDVIDGGTLAMCPGAINVAEFYEDFD